MRELPDVQTEMPEIRTVIQRVGVSEVELPFYLTLRDGGSGPTQIIAKTEMTCMLNDYTRGISMSRFLRSIQPFLRQPLKRTILECILKTFLDIHGTDSATLQFDFKIPIMVESPLSDNEFPQYYKCGFRCEYINGREFRFYEKVRVQYSAYCPCSAALGMNGKYGYPHNQRAFADVVVRTHRGEYVWLENLVDAVKDAVKIVPYPIIKRSDEKFIAGQARNYQFFVEDAIRAISKNIDRVNGVIDWFVRCTHEESIHTSNAIAKHWKGIKFGLGENTYI